MTRSTALVGGGNQGGFRYVGSPRDRILATVETLLAGDFNTDPTDARFASERTFAILKENDAAESLLRFISDHRIKILNVAGPRASKEPQIAAFVKPGFLVLDRESGGLLCAAGQG